MSTTQNSELTGLVPVDLDAGTVFSGRASGVMVRGFAAPSMYTPAIDHSYVFHGSSRDIIVWFLGTGPDPLYLFGPLGAGKTSLIKQIAARINYPVLEVTGHGRLEFSDLVGHLSVREGGMVFEDGPLTLAMRHGALLLVNEIDLIQPEVAAGLNSILDGSPLCIPENGGELIVPHPMFRLAATANSNGGGDDTGLYQGVLRQNAAFLDRFILAEADYPDARVEKSLLMKRHPSLPEDIADRMVRFANEVRRLFTSDGANAIELTFSTRSILRWGELTLKFQPLAAQGIQPVSYALDRALAFRGSRETRAMLHEMVQRIFTRQVAASPRPADGTLSGDAALSFVADMGLSGMTPRNGKGVLVYLTKQSDDGVSMKFWRGEASPHGLKLSWGRVGTAGNARFFKSADCVNGNPFTDLESRLKAKIGRGYALHSNIDIDNLKED